MCCAGDRPRAGAVHQAELGAGELEVENGGLDDKLMQSYLLRHRSSICPSVVTRTQLRTTWSTTDKGSRLDLSGAEEDIAVPEPFSVQEYDETVDLKFDKNKANPFICVPING